MLWLGSLVWIYFFAFFDFDTGWIIAAMWPFDWMYPLLLWLPKFGCPWVVASSWLDNGVGGGASYAIDPGVPLAWIQWLLVTSKMFCSLALDDLKLFFRRCRHSAYDMVCSEYLWVMGRNSLV
jgi:hypothetical protein